MMSEGQRAKIRRRLDAAGKPGGMTLENYAGRKAAFTVVLGTAGFLFLLDGNYLLAAALATMGFVWIDVWLSGVARRRQARIERDLPDFLDILAVTVSAGVGFRPALVRVSEALGGPLGEEMMVALRQMDLGFGRRQAFEAIRERNESESLDLFVTALLQAEELGVPLADALGNLAADMRRSFYQAARRRAARAAPRVSLIVSLLIVPGALLLMLASLILGSNLTPGNVLGG
jgi:tight adherence protein C